MKRVEQAWFVIAAAAITVAAAAQDETVDYGYDARGRLVKVERSGNVNNGVTANYVYDKADNRTLKNVTGAPK